MKTLHKHQELLEEYDRQIVELIDKRWRLFLEDNHPGEVEEGWEVLVDDPFNTINVLMEPESAVFRWLVVDEVLALREARGEEGEEG